MGHEDESVNWNEVAASVRAAMELEHPGRRARMERAADLCERMARGELVERTSIERLTEGMSDGAILYVREVREALK